MSASITEPTRMITIIAAAITQPSTSCIRSVSSCHCSSDMQRIPQAHRGGGPAKRPAIPAVSLDRAHETVGVADKLHVRVLVIMRPLVAGEADRDDRVEDHVVVRREQPRLTV